MKYHIADVVAGFFFVTMIYVLVRPQSKAAELVNGASRALVALVRTATTL